jgi:hypothetical protein
MGWIYKQCYTTIAQAEQVFAKKRARNGSHCGLGPYSRYSTDTDIFGSVPTNNYVDESVGEYRSFQAGYANGDHRFPGLNEQLSFIVDNEDFATELG